MATFCCMPRLICSSGRPRRDSAMPRRARIRIDSRFATRGVEPVEPSGVDQVLGRRQLLEEGRIDADPVDQPLDRHLLTLDVVAEDLDPARVDGQQRADQPDEGRLAAAVGAQDAVDLAALDAQRDVVDGDRPSSSCAPTTNRLVRCSMSKAGMPGTAARRRQRRAPRLRSVVFRLVVRV